MESQKKSEELEEIINPNNPIWLYALDTKLLEKSTSTVINDLRTDEWIAKPSPHYLDKPKDLEKPQWGNAVADYKRKLFSLKIGDSNIEYPPDFNESKQAFFKDNDRLERKFDHYYSQGIASIQEVFRYSLNDLYLLTRKQEDIFLSFDLQNKTQFRIKDETIYANVLLENIFYRDCDCSKNTKCGHLIELPGSLMATYKLTKDGFKLQTIYTSNHLLMKFVMYKNFDSVQELKKEIYKSYPIDWIKNLASIKLPKPSTTGAFIDVLFPKATELDLTKTFKDLQQQNNELGSRLLCFLILALQDYDKIYDKIKSEIYAAFKLHHKHFNSENLLPALMLQINSNLQFRMEKYLASRDDKPPADFALVMNYYTLLKQYNDNDNMLKVLILAIIQDEGINKLKDSLLGKEFMPELRNFTLIYKTQFSEAAIVSELIKELPKAKGMQKLEELGQKLEKQIEQQVSKKFKK